MFTQMKFNFRDKKTNDQFYWEEINQLKKIRFVLVYFYLKSGNKNNDLQKIKIKINLMFNIAIRNFLINLELFIWTFLCFQIVVLFVVVDVFAVFSFVCKNEMKVLFK